MGHVLTTVKRKEPRLASICLADGNIELTHMNFEQDVIEKSTQIPVVVDFWAPWCGPCRTLGPIIEQLAEDANGRWVLVKVNTDDNPELMQRFGIRGIPAVKMFHQGKVIDEFTGLMPKHEIEKWLDKNIPDPRLAALKVIKQDLYKLKEFVDNHPDLIEAKVDLIRLQLFDDPVHSMTIAADVPAGIKYFDTLESYKTLAEFLTFSDSSDSPVAIKLKAAQEAARQQNHQQAIEWLIDSILLDKSHADELARRVSIAYFQYLGKDHSVTKNLRRRFDMALY